MDKDHEMFGLLYEGRDFIVFGIQLKYLCACGGWSSLWIG